MIRLKLAAAAALLSVLAGAVPAQAPPQMPKPGPEHKRLQYFVGQWTSEFDMKPGPFGPGGKVTMIDRCEMLAGDFFLVTHSTGKSQMGEMKGLSVWGYDPEEKIYTFAAYNSFGMAEHFKGTVQGDTWTWTSESKVEGKIVKSRFTLKEVSPSLYTFRYDASADGAAWANVMEGKATKVK